MITVKNLLENKGYNTWSVLPEATVYEALQKMAEKEIGAVMVMQNENLVGIFSERDYARKLVLKNQFSKDSIVKDYMSTNVFSVKSETGILECMNIMTDKHIRHLPVLENQKVIGIVTIGDIVNEIIKRQKSTIDDLESYIYGGNYGTK